MQKTKYIIGVAAVVALVLIASVIFDMAGVGKSLPVDIKIADGDGADAIAQRLKLSGVINNKFAFKAYSKLTGEHIFQKGTHSLDSSMSYGEILRVIESAPNDNSRKVLIPEGYELRDIADTLEKEGLINKDIFLREASVGNFDYDFLLNVPKRENRLEGYLYPDTYIFTDNMTERDIISVMLDNFNRIVVPIYNESQTKKSLDEIIILASVIEREAASDDERGLVSSVFINRINKGMKLESCATVQYVLKERKSVLSNEDTKIDSPYNTYKNAGLPIGPISAPGIKSIEAAIYPENTNFLYFMATNDGSKSVFSETYDQHLANQRQIQG